MKKNRVIEWFHLYSADVNSYLIYYTGHLDVEDLVQEVFVKAAKNIHRFQGTSSPKTWLISIARNVAIDRIRKWKKEQKKLERLKNQMPFSPVPTPEELFERNEQKMELYKNIKMLKPSYQEVIILRGIKEMTVKEVSEVLNWNENKVRVTYHRALKALESQYGGTVNETFNYTK